MSWLSAHLFARIQATPAYRQVHQQAVQLLPPGAGQTWLDVGCGPGLVARLAHAHGYAAQGVDLDPAMVLRARVQSARAQQDLPFRQASLDDLAAAGPQADVVSAASLLAVLPERNRALRQLACCVAPGGQLLLVEPSEYFDRDSIQAHLQRHPPVRGAWALRLWGATRRPSRAVHTAELQLAGYSLAVHPLLGGLVNAWILQNKSQHRSPKM